ncbi:MAG: phosphatase PAP2 family protein [Selenomonadaceae bacterium]|nr:phosphatase PAP2 family protein [Selenomonadaceae bacterium]
MLFLQGVRESFGGWLTTLVEIVTAIPASPLSALIPGILFWCVSKRAGLFLLAAASFGRLINSLVKDIFCVYRPWILDSSVHPVQSALKVASSYSFPSGHTQFATAIYGGLAYFYRKKFPQLIIPCALIILAVAFSRNFLGVHTPQDVLAAILETVVVMIIAEKIFDAVERDRRLGVLVFGAGVIFTAAAGFYMLTKNYPVDYLYGKIIVTPETARLDSIDSVGVAAGFLIGWALENRFVNFSLNVDRATKIRRVIIGGVTGGAAMALLLVMKKFGGGVFYEFCKGFLPLFTVIFLAPLAFSCVERKLRFKRL